MQNNISLYFLPLSISAGLVTCYTDIRYHKIKNAHLIFFFILTAFLYLGLFLSKNPFLTGSAIYIFANIAVALAIAFFFFSNKLWAGGDAKLFILYSLLIPTNAYSDILPLPTFVLFANTFLISLLIVTITLIIKQGKKIMTTADHTAILAELGKIFLITTSIMWVLAPLQGIIRIKNVVFLNFILVYFLYFFFSRLIFKFNKTLLFVLVPAGLILRLLIYPGSFSHFYSLLKVTIFFYALLYFYRAITSNKKNEGIDIGRISFAPFLFFGVLASQTKFLLIAMQLLSFIRK